MIAAASHPVPRPAAKLRLGGATIDLGTRALVAGVVPAPRFAREGEVLAAAAAIRAAGADLADISLAPRLIGPVARQGGTSIASCAPSAEVARAAVAAGAAVVLAPPAAVHEVVHAVAEMGVEPAGQVAVVVDDLDELRRAAELADQLGVPLALDTTRWSPSDALAGEPVGLACGCRIVRTADVRRTRRIVEVVAALIEARRDR